MSMAKIGVIIRHEIISRIRTKAFVIATLLAPLGILAIVGIPILTTINAKDDSVKRIAIVDEGKIIASKLVAKDPSLFFTTTNSIDNLTAQTKNKEITGYMVIPKDVLTQDTVNVYSMGGGGLLFYKKVEDALQSVVNNERLRLAGLDSLAITRIERGIEVKNQKISEKGVEKDAGEVLTLVGYVMGFFIYMMMFIYGGIVMRAVLEEKTNRIVEVLASSAKPFEIMMGKIIGVGVVGLIQVLLWVAISSAIQAAAAPMIMKYLGASDPQQALGMLKASGQTLPQIAFHLPSISPWMIIGFIFYFLSGYFLYATLFAAIAAAADQEQDMQTLQLPITLPLIIPMLMIGRIMEAPDGTFATVLSMIPLFTPTLMMVRAGATSIPVWQIVASSVLMIATFFAAVWAAGRIYRVGILSYGKKASFKDMLRWLVKA